jgi:hypothetical protein
MGRSIGLEAIGDALRKRKQQRKALIPVHYRSLQGREYTLTIIVENNQREREREKQREMYTELSQEPRRSTAKVPP